MELTDTDRANLDRARQVGERLGYMLNPNTKRVLKIANLMAGNEEQWGKRYCPCRQSHPIDPEKDVVCPCPGVDEEIARDGHCHCWLFFEKPKDEADKPCEN